LELTLSSHYPPQSEFLIRYDQPSIIARAYKSGETVWVEDITNDSDYISVLNDTAFVSELVVPVKIGDEIKALINIESTHQDEIGEVEKRLLDIVALHVSSTIERLQRNSDLTESEERLRVLSQNAGDAILMVTQKKDIVFWNPAAERIFGYAETEATSSTLEELIIPKDRWEAFNIEFAGIIEHRNENDNRVRVAVAKRSDDSTIEIGFTASVIELDETPHVVFIMRDVTEQKRAQERIFDLLEQTRSLNQELERSNQDLENYTYVVSHDLKAPLRSIRSFGGFILEDNKDQLDEDGVQFMDRIITAATHMDDLISDLLLLSRVGRRFTEPEVVNLNEVIEGIIEDITPSITEKDATVNIAKLPTVNTQKTWIRQLFTNLITNGLKFNKSPSPIIEIMVEEKPDKYIFSVADDGIGISPEYHAKIFQLFERLHSSSEYEGTGAGLTICMRIVENFGGKIWVESEEGQGSTFYFTFPKAEMET
jgi:PAS domain S-box-containing protein